MNPIQIVILALVAAFLVSGLLNHSESDLISLDTLFTLAFLGYIWHVLRRNKSAGGDAKGVPQPPPDTHYNRQDADFDPDEDPEPEPAPPSPHPPSPYVVSHMLRSTGRVIMHKVPWAIVEQGKAVGSFRHVPIPAWIRTSDNRKADYAGIALVPPPEECVCLELPDQAELILPPGLIYAIRS
ncbi:MAG: hypothetical protein H7839_24210 [Magnetococcus sp. YQC-5]